MDKGKITNLLKNYRSYRQAVLNYENYVARPAAGVANYDGMPSGSGAPEQFFRNQGKMADMGLTSAMDHYDYEMYKAIVCAVDFSVAQVLSDDEAHVIKSKWLDRNTMELYKIAIAKDRDESTIRRWHREALMKLTIALMFVKVPHIEEKCTENARYMPVSSW